MRSSQRQSIQEAEALYERFLENNRQVSKIRMSNPRYDPERLRYLGKNLHAISDSTSPMHAGFQVWNLSQGIEHFVGELTINSGQLSNAISEVRKEYFRHVEAAERFDRQIRIGSFSGLSGFGSFASSLISFGGFVGFF